MAKVPEQLKEELKLALQKEGIYSPEVLAYALATIERETGGTFKPIEEIGGRSQARKLGYSGGENFFGRGYIQLTHDYNYLEMGQKIGLGDALVRNPRLALDPRIAAQILAVFFKERGVVDYIKQGDFVKARLPINGTDFAQQIARSAESYLKDLNRQEKKLANSPSPDFSQSGEFPSAALNALFPITQRFGNFNPQIERFSGGINYGTDFGTPTGTPIFIPDGNWKIAEVFNGAGRGYIGDGTNNGYGNSLLITNQDTGEKIRFSHLEYTPFKNGETVSGGFLAYTGTSGNSTGPHLDIEYYDSNGKIKDIAQTQYANQIFTGDISVAEGTKNGNITQSDQKEEKKTSLLDKIVKPAFAETPKENLERIKKSTSPIKDFETKSDVKKSQSELLKRLSSRFKIPNQVRSNRSSSQNILTGPILQMIQQVIASRSSSSPANANTSTERGPVFTPPPASSSSSRVPMPPVSSGSRQNFTPANANFSSSRGVSSFIPAPPRVSSPRPPSRLPGVSFDFRPSFTSQGSARLR